MIDFLHLSDEFYYSVILSVAIVGFLFITFELCVRCKSEPDLNDLYSPVLERSRPDERLYISKLPITKYKSDDIYPSAMPQV